MIQKLTIFHFFLTHTKTVAAQLCFWNCLYEFMDAVCSIFLVCSPGSRLRPCILTEVGELCDQKFIVAQGTESKHKFEMGGNIKLNWVETQSVIYTRALKPIITCTNTYIHTYIQTWILTGADLEFSRGERIFNCRRFFWWAELIFGSSQNTKKALCCFFFFGRNASRSKKLWIDLGWNVFPRSNLVKT